ncbi:MAG: TldD/PmbA family protein [Candidatus Obscuribacterales bacterium]|nr:TldD/PmbA family protein [Candidatus Obscuribacterales bacterium]
MDTLVLHTLDAAQKAGADYADVRLIEEQYEFIQTKDLMVSGFSKGTSRGAGIRVLKNGGWGFASTQKITKPELEKAAKRAVQLAAASASCMRKPVALAPEPVYDAVWASPHLVDPFSVSTEDKLDVLLTCARTMLGVKGVTLAQGRLSFVKEKKTFASTAGTRLQQTFVRSGCCIEAFATNAEERQRRSYPKHVGQFELAGWEMVKGWDLPGNAQRIAEEAVALLTAPQCPSETKDLILGASQLGLQIHESCGHPSELDRALGQEINFAGASFLTPEKLQTLKYGSPIVNLVADATAKGALGSFGFDDEGVAAQRVYLVKDGMFNGYLSSRDTAHLIGLERSGGAMRAQSWSHVPIIRMTNISIVPGSAGTLEDLISDTDDAVLMETNQSWSIDQMRYNFQFSTEIAWEIKKGKRGRMFKNPSYSGITPEFWNSCDAICGADEYVEWGEPNCGKGQPCQTMWTGHGASPARFRNVQIGIAHSK